MHDTGCSGLVHWDDPEGWDVIDLTAIYHEAGHFVANRERNAVFGERNANARLVKNQDTTRKSRYGLNSSFRYNVIRSF